VKRCMEKVRVYYNREMDTLDVWFEGPPEEGFSRGISDGIILKYDLDGSVFGVEILFLSKQEKLPEGVKSKFEESINEFINMVKALA